MGGVATHNSNGQDAKKELDEKTLDWICNRSNGISRVFINKWMSSLGWSRWRAAGQS